MIVLFLYLLDNTNLANEILIIVLSAVDLLFILDGACFIRA